MVDTDRLWGGTIAAVEVDLTTWTMTFRVTVLDSGVVERWDLVLVGVAEFRATRDIPLPWTYAELTEVHVSALPAGVAVELVLWSESSTITIRAASIEVVGIDPSSPAPADP